MKFCAKEQDKAITIRDFKIVDNKIIVYFLDNSSYEIPYNKRNIESIIELMLKQARYRNDYFNIHDTNVSFFLSFYLSASFACLSILSLYAMVKNLTTANQINYSFAYPVPFLLLLSSLEFKSACNEQDKMEELEKYQILFELLDKNLIDICNQKLNINNIDGYTIKEVKDYQKTLRKEKKTHN